MRTDDEGVYRFTNLAPGQYMGHVEPGEFRATPYRHVDWTGVASSSSSLAMYAPMSTSRSSAGGRLRYVWSMTRENRSPACVSAHFHRTVDATSTRQMAC